LCRNCDSKIIEIIPHLPTLGLFVPKYENVARRKERFGMIDKTNAYFADLSKLLYMNGTKKKK